MFLGEYQTKFFSPGRVILPKNLRNELASNVIILSKGFEDCIWGFSEKDFNREAKKTLEISVTEERARFLRRYIFASAMPAELDSQGRFTVPSTLLTYAKIKKEAVIVGAGDHFEIWDTKIWQKHIMEVERSYGTLSPTRSS